MTAARRGSMNGIGKSFYLGGGWGGEEGGPRGVGDVGRSQTRGFTGLVKYFGFYFYLLK